MSSDIGVMQCPVCRGSDLTVVPPGRGTPPMVFAIEGESRLLKPIACATCTSVWFVYGEPTLPASA